VPIWHRDKYEPFINTRDKAVRTEEEFNRLAREGTPKRRKV
jgi:hypothetical protein